MQEKSAKNELQPGGRSFDRLIYDKKVRWTYWEHIDARNAGKDRDDRKVQENKREPCLE